VGQYRQLGVQCGASLIRYSDLAFATTATDGLLLTEQQGGRMRDTHNGRTWEEAHTDETGRESEGRIG
jgi:hypothetical protein